jgi:hypothetical protein
MIPLCSRFDSVLFTPKNAIASYGNYSRSPEDSSRHEHRPSRENLGGAADLAERNRLFLGAVQESDAAEGYELSSETKRDIADCFLRLADQALSDYIRNVSQRGPLRNANDSIKRPRRNVRVSLGDVELVFVLMHRTISGELRQ